MIDLPGASPALSDLAALGTPHVYSKGRLLIEEGDHGDTLHIVVGGRLRVYSVNADNGREITYGTYGPGEYVGEMSLDGGPRSASVEVVEKGTTCITVTRTTIERFIGERPEFAFELLAKVIARARAATLSARQMALNDVYGRLKALLESTENWRAMTHLEIADRIGCTRSMVSRLLKDLERGGFVGRDGGRRLVALRALPARW